MYQYTDKQLAALMRQYMSMFRRLRLMNFDELNTLNRVVSVYQKADALAKKAYLDIAGYAYLYGAGEAERAGFHGKKKRKIDADWLIDFLEETDDVTMYDYDNEWERKRQRLEEALVATNTPLKELDKALKLMTLQVSHYADKATAEAVLQAFRDAGVKKVQWVTEQDDRVCQTCKPLNGKIFDIGKTPQIPAHFRCRCRLRPVK